MINVLKVSGQKIKGLAVANVCLDKLGAVWDNLTAAEIINDPNFVPLSH
jgi:hypothetical protein